jgi:hypothetical protein
MTHAAACHPQLAVDGTVYSVPHPDWLSVPPARRPREAVYYLMPEEGTASQVDDYEVHWLDLNLISEVIETMVSAQPKAKGNGE